MEMANLADTSAMIANKYLRSCLYYLPILALLACLDIRLETVPASPEDVATYTTFVLLPHLLAIFATFIAFWVKAPLASFVILCNLNGLVGVYLYGGHVFFDDTSKLLGVGSNAYMHFLMFPLLNTITIILLLIICFIISRNSSNVVLPNDSLEHGDTHVE